MSGSTATIPVGGVILRKVPEFFSFFGIEATSTEEIDALIKMAMADDQVTDVRLEINSPGGTIAGVDELAATIRKARDTKPIKAVVQDLAASAAYWIASQATEIEASRTSFIGSIGVYRAIVDSSEAHENEGIKVHLIKSGEHKGAGMAGVKVTEAQIAVEQELIDQAAGMFVDAVATGRGVAPDKIQELATGRVWMGDEAKANGLIDTITTGHAGEQQTARKNSAIPEGQSMADENTGEGLEAKLAELADQVAELKSGLEAKSAELDAEQIKGAAMQAAFEGIRSGQRADIIKGASEAGKVTPAMKATVEKFAEACGDDLDQLRVFVAALPVQVRADTMGQTPTEDNRIEISDADQAVADLFGLDAKAMDATGNWAGIRADGKPVDQNGNEIRGIH